MKKIDSKRKSKASKKRPTVLLQDPARKRSYLLTNNALEQAIAGEETWQNISPSTVTFLIPHKNFIEEVPPFLSASNTQPSILIQNPELKESYFFSFDDLQKYEDTKRRNYGEGYDISFVIPTGLEKIAELPMIMRDCLQSNESGGQPSPLIHKH